MKKLVSVLIASVLTLSLSGCLPFVVEKKEVKEEIPTMDINAVATVKEISNDLEGWYLPTQESVTLAEIDVISRNTSDVTDKVYVKALGETDEVKCEMYYNLTYNYTPSSGWSLQSVDGTQWDKWTVTPMVGLSEDILKEEEAELRDYEYEYHRIDCPSISYGYNFKVEECDFEMGDTIARMELSLRYKSENCNYGVKRVGEYEFVYSTSGNELTWGWEPVEETIENWPWEYEMPKYTGKAIFRVRRNPDDADGQIGAYASLENAIAEADLHWEEGYEVYDLEGVFVYRTYPELQ